MLLEERHNFILSYLHANGSARTSDLVSLLNVSSETIRKDLEMMMAKGLLERVHGGAMLSSANNTPRIMSNSDYVGFDDRQQQNTDRKIIIAKAAANLVKEGQSIALDAGTSSLELAKVLAESFARLTIITNSLKIAMQLAKSSDFTVICTGGILTKDEYSFVSDFATMILDKVNIDIMFLTASGITKNGLTDQRISEIKIQDKMREVSEKIIVLADSSKFGNTSLVKLCNLNEIDIIITDSGVDASMVEELRNSVEIMVV